MHKKEIANSLQKLPHELITLSSLFIVDNLVAKIEARNQQLSDECISDKNSSSYMQLKPEARKNQTCVMSFRDQSLVIQVNNLSILGLLKSQ